MANVNFENIYVPELTEEYTTSSLEKKFEEQYSSHKLKYSDHAAEKKSISNAYANLLSASEETFDYNEKQLNDSYISEKEKQSDIISLASQIRQNQDLLNKYGESFAYLYKIKDKTEKFGEDIELYFQEIPDNKPQGILTQEQYFELNADNNNEKKQIALHVKLNKDEEFDITMPPYDKPGKENKTVKAQISISDNTLEKINAEKLAKIMEFCETHGLSTFQMDIPYSFDGNINIDEKFHSMLQLLQEQKKQEIENENKQEADKIENITKDNPNINIEEQCILPPEENIIEENQAENKPAKKQKKKDVNDAIAGIDKFISGGLKKRQGFSYFKKGPGILGKGWTEFVIYDSENRNNLKNDGKRDKDGNPKFSYSSKIFVRENNGKIQFAYRAPNRKKVDDSIINGLAGQMKGLGLTHVSFPNGLPDNEKKVWRIALAENGIVPKGFGLDKVKAEGMLKAAKEKLPTEDYRKYRYRLAVQMDKENKEKGKVISPSEQDFIDSLINSQKYLAFTEGYGNAIKSRLRDMIDRADMDKNNGAVEKTAAYIAMRRLFDVYKEGVDSSSLLNSSMLTNEEKQQIMNSGLTGNVSKFNEAQIAQLFEILLPKSRKDAKQELDEALMSARDTNTRQAYGPKRADNIIIKEVFDGARMRFEKINEMLGSLGVDEINFPKAFGRLHYDTFYHEHPEYFRKPQQNSNSQQEEQPQLQQQTPIKDVVEEENRSIPQPIKQSDRDR